MVTQYISKLEFNKGWKYGATGKNPRAQYHIN